MLRQHIAALSGGVERLITLNNLYNNPGARKKRKRVGRGMGSKGKTSGYGHQRSRVTPRGFEGGQTQMYKRLPKIGFHNPNAREIIGVNLGKIQDFIDRKRLIIPEDGMITMRDLVLCGLVKNPHDGIKIIAGHKEYFKTKVHFEVTSASAEAIKTIEAHGGTVTAVHFNRLAMRALIKPWKFELFPQRARPPPNVMPYYWTAANCGYLAPEIQLRNIKLFGAVTSEERLRAEHEAFMKRKREKGLLTYR